MAWYADWVRSNILLSAFVQFAVLGTVGEILGIAAAKQKTRDGMLRWLAKALVWGLLGILIKYAFTGFKGFLQILVDQRFLPTACESAPVLKAFSLSFLTNAMFGPLLMFLHRSSDNVIARAKGYAGINRSLATLAWFWVPAHTLTFSLPVDFQIGLAALWSVMLGIIMGFTKRRG